MINLIKSNFAKQYWKAMYPTIFDNTEVPER